MLQFISGRLISSYWNLFIYFLIFQAVV